MALKFLFNSWHLYLREKFEQEEGMRQNITELTQRSVSGCHFPIHFNFKKWKTNLPKKIACQQKELGVRQVVVRATKGTQNFLFLLLLWTILQNVAWPVKRSDLSAGHQALNRFRLLTALLGLHKSCVCFLKTSLSKNGNIFFLLFH